MEAVEFLPQLLGERVILRRFEESHAGPLYQIVQTERERLNEFLPWPNFINSVEDELEFIERMKKQWDERSCFGFSVVLAATQAVIGAIDLHALSWSNSRGEIGYWLSGKYEGKGYMFEAVGVLEEYLFELGFNRIEIRCDQKNIRSKGVPVKRGYLHEGTLREDFLDGDQYRNTEIYGKIVSDLK